MPAEKASRLRQLRQLGLGQETLKGNAAQVDGGGGAGGLAFAIDLGGEKQSVAIVTADQHELALMGIDADGDELGGGFDNAEQRALLDKGNQTVQRIGTLAGKPCRVVAIARNAVVRGEHEARLPHRRR